MRCEYGNICVFVHVHSFVLISAHTLGGPILGPHFSMAAFCFARASVRRCCSVLHTHHTPPPNTTHEHSTQGIWCEGLTHCYGAEVSHNRRGAAELQQMPHGNV